MLMGLCKASAFLKLLFVSLEKDCGHSVGVLIQDVSGLGKRHALIPTEKREDIPAREV